LPMKLRLNMSINELASLLSDAELLFDHERYGRATALGQQPLPWPATPCNISGLCGAWLEKARQRLGNFTANPAMVDGRRRQLHCGLPQLCDFGCEFKTTRASSISSPGPRCPIRTPACIMSPGRGL
jgi:hypothetical protein